MGFVVLTRVHACLDWPLIENFKIVCIQLFHKDWRSLTMCTSARSRLRARMKENYCQSVNMKGTVREDDSNQSTQGYLLLATWTVSWKTEADCSIGREITHGGQQKSLWVKHHAWTMLIHSLSSSFDHEAQPILCSSFGWQILLLKLHGWSVFYDKTINSVLLAQARPTMIKDYLPNFV